MPQPDVLDAFEAGWSHRYQGEEAVGYYIGREHFPFTQLKVVKAIDPGSSEYFRPCEEGEPGYLLTRGPNLMSGYVGDPEATRDVFREGWYTGLRDIVFTLRNKKDGQLDYYWMSRDSALLVRGGANYAYDQVAAELSGFLMERFQLKREQFHLAVVGIRWGSEHEDSCCVTVELEKDALEAEPAIKERFVAEACACVSKGARPNFLRFASIPRSFKGAVLYPQLKQEFLEFLKNAEKRT
jgi:acyl-CoA synthetase (AMP-forming)/AMP-acid ligase II